MSLTAGRWNAGGSGSSEQYASQPTHTMALMPTTPIAHTSTLDYPPLLKRSKAIPRAGLVDSCHVNKNFAHALGYATLNSFSLPGPACQRKPQNHGSLMRRTQPMNVKSSAIGKRAFRRPVASAISTKFGQLHDVFLKAGRDTDKFFKLIGGHVKDAVLCHLRKSKDLEDKLKMYTHSTISLGGTRDTLYINLSYPPDSAGKITFGLRAKVRCDEEGFEVTQLTEGGTSSPAKLCESLNCAARATIAVDSARRIARMNGKKVAICWGIPADVMRTVSEEMAYF